jgi:hypothetical protein
MNFTVSNTGNAQQGTIVAFPPLPLPGVKFH